MIRFSKWRFELPSYISSICLPQCHPLFTIAPPPDRSLQRITFNAGENHKRPFIYHLVTAPRLPLAAILPKKKPADIVPEDSDAETQSHCDPLFKFFEEQERLGNRFSLLMMYDVKNHFCLLCTAIHMRELV
jgi:hypothetical protein